MSHSLLASVLSSLQGIRQVPNALSLPTVILRESLPEDAPYLLAAAQSSGFRSVNFQSGLAALQRKIEASQRTFADPSTAVGEFMFSVLSGSDESAFPVGSSTLYPKHGTDEAPHNAYRIVDDPEDPYLALVTDADGPAEVGAIIVHAALQGLKGRSNRSDPAEIFIQGARHLMIPSGGYGRAASWVRFLWTAMPEVRDAFRNRECLAEMLPPLEGALDTGRTNAFYEAVVKPHFDGRPYEEMDVATHEDRDLIRRRLPKRIALSTLPEAARSLLGRVGAKSEPALSLLRKLGFRDTRCVDPIDAGPHYAGRFAENPLFTGAMDLYFGGSSDTPAETGWTYGMLGVHRPGRGVRFRAAMGGFCVADDTIYTTRDVAQGMILRIGEKVTAAVAPL